MSGVSGFFSVRVLGLGLRCVVVPMVLGYIGSEVGIMKDVKGFWRRKGVREKVSGFGVGFQKTLGLFPPRYWKCGREAA